MRLLPLLMLGMPTLAGAADRYTLDPGHTFPSFEIRHHGVSTLRGKFKRSQGMARFDPKGGTGYIEVTVDAPSVDTGHDELNRYLLDNRFFNTAVYPEIRFVAEDVRFANGKPVEARGQLTLLGVTRPWTVEIRDYTCTIHFLKRVPLCGADVHATMRRSDFGMSYGIPLIGDEVKLAIEVEGFGEWPAD